MIKNHHYYLRYTKFIARLKDQTIDGYYELHHIIPRSLGGSDDSTNLIALTARQHFVAHWILAKAYGGAMSRAFYMMSNFGKYGYTNSTVYENARVEYSKLVSEQMKKRPPPKFTKEHREKLRLAKLGTKLSETTKQKVGAAQVGRKLSEETKRKISESKRGIATRGSGWSHSEETKMKMKQSQKFKADVLAGAELQDADGNVMLQEAANLFISELP